jgi:hypothetical protein
MGGSGDGGVGPVGTRTNTPSIDPGTTARMRHVAPKTRVAQAGKPELDYFDVSRLFPVLEAQQWTEGKRFMEFWTQGKACTAKIDTTIDFLTGRPSPTNGKATIGLNLDNTCIRTLTVKWDWLLKFPEAKDPYDTFVKKKLFNDAAVEQLIKAYGRAKPGGQAQYGAFGDFLKEGLKPEDFRGEIKEHQRQSMLVDVNADPSKLNDQTAAMANFAYYAMYQGETFRVGEMEKNQKDLWPYLVDQYNLSPSVSPKDIDELIARLKQIWAQFESLIFVKAVGVYAGDLYEFTGFQYLGRWDLENKTVGGSKKNAFGTFVHNSPGPDDKVVDIENKTFREYRDKTKMGGDFFVFTPIKLIDIKPARMIPVPR